MKSLAIVCRAMGTMLQSGVALPKCLDLAAGKSSDSKTRVAFQQIAEDVRNGSDLAGAMRQQGKRFPDLMVEMVEMAEQTGYLAEVFGDLANHYDSNIKLRRDFLSAIAWPAFQFIAAVGVIAILILILGLIADSTGRAPMDFLGLGLAGPSGAIIWMCMTYGSVAALIGGYFVAARMFEAKRFLDPLLMKIPVVGGCMQSFGIARFSWAYYLTQQSGMLVTRSIEASLRATANGAFMNASPQVCAMLEAGEDLSTALRASGLFPEDFLHMVMVGESSGTVPEALHRLSPQFEEQARRSMRRLAVTMGWVVWSLVAAFIVVLIFRVLLTYVGMLNSALDDAMQ